MSVSKDELDHVLRLAHLHVPEEEKEDYLFQLQNTLETMKSLDHLDLSQVVPSAHATLDTHFLREDEAQNSADLLLETNAPDWEDGCFSVPQILGEA